MTHRRSTGIADSDSDVERLVLEELAKSLLGGRPLAEFGHAALVLMMLLLLWNDVSSLLLLSWASAVLATVAIRLYLRSRFVDQVTDPLHVSRLVRGAVVFSATAWSAGPILYGASLPIEHYALIMVVFAGLVAAATSTLQADRLAFRLFSCILLIPLATVLVLGGMTHFHLVALIMITLFGTMMWQQQQRAFEQLLGQLRISVEQGESERNALKNRRFLQSLLTSAPIAVAGVDRDGEILLINPAFEALLGYSAEDAVGADINELLIPYGEVECGRGLDEEVRAGRTVSQEVICKHKNGSLVQVRASRALAGEGAEGTIFVMYDDLTETNKARNELLEREEYYRSLLHSLHEDIMVIDRDYRIVDVNNSAIRTIGAAREEVIGRPCFEISHGYASPCDRHGETCVLPELWRTGTPQQCRHVHVRKDGTTHHADILVSPLRDEHGNVTMAIEAVRGVTELMQVQEELAQSERRFRDMVANLAEGVGIVDPDEQFLFANPAAERIFGVESGDLVGRSLNEFVDSDTSEMFAGQTDARVRGQVSKHEFPITAADGRKRHLTVAVAPQFGESNEYTGALGTFRDITDQKEAQDALAESEALFRAITTSAQDAILMINSEGVIVLWNESAERTLGYSVDEAMGSKLHRLIVPERFRDSHLAAFPRFVETGQGEAIGQTLELAALRKDGIEIPVELSLSSVSLNGRWHSIGILRDISARKQVEAEHRRLNERVADREARFRTLYESTGDAIMLLDEDGFFSCNSATLSIFDCRTEEEFCSLHPGQLSPARQPDGRDSMTAAKEKIAMAMKEGSARFEWRHIRNATGEEFPAEVLLSAMQLGDRTVLQASVRDITERKRAESVLETSLEAAEQAARAKAAFLANMSHEIRTPIHGVLGMLELMLDGDLPTEQRRLAELAHDSGEALLGIINDVLDFTKIESGRLELEEITFDPGGLAEAVVRMLFAKAEERAVELVCDVHPDVPRGVRGDPGRIRQVLTNIVGNAVKFTRNGEVVVEVAARGSANGRVDLAFSVTDTGIGISPEKLGAIFEDFNQADVSTSRKFGGSGLGLAISARLLALMGSEMAVESEEGRGSCFSFVVSLTVEEADVPEISGVLDSLRGKRVLVVDDNATNRRIMCDMLVPLGTIVVTAPGAWDALEVLSGAVDERVPYDVCIVDGHMPEIDGYELAEMIRADKGFAGIKLLMLTSGGKAGDGKRCRTLEISAYLTKPVSRADLVETLVRVLAPRAEEQVEQLVTRHTIEEGRVQVRVLLAEDNFVNQTIAVSMLRKRGHQVQVANNGREAVDAALNGEFDVVLMDIQMPVLDGWAATREIRANPAFENLQIIALTAHSGENERAACQAAGMDGFLCKPFKPHELFSVVEGWGGGAELVEESGDCDAVDESVPYPVDLNVLRETLGDAAEDGIVDVVIDVFVHDAPERLRAIEAAIASEDGESLRKAAHAFKSSAGTIGALGLAEMLKKIEENGKEFDSEAVAKIVRSLRNETEAVVEFLNQNR